MYTTKVPTQCRGCGSKKIYFNVDEYVKDKNGKDTKEPRLGVWYCAECNRMVGRKMSKDYNEIY